MVAALANRRRGQQPVARPHRWGESCRGAMARSSQFAAATTTDLAGPLESISNAQEVELVLKGDAIIDRSTMDLPVSHKARHDRPLSDIPG